MAPQEVLDRCRVAVDRAESERNHGRARERVSENVLVRSDTWKEPFGFVQPFGKVGLAEVVE